MRDTAERQPGRTLFTQRALNSHCSVVEIVDAGLGLQAGVAIL